MNEYPMPVRQLLDRGEPEFGDDWPDYLALGLGAEHVPDLGGAGQGRNELGLLYVDGLGVPKDYIQAYMWFTLANDEQNCKYVQDKMTPAQISEAQRMAEEWKRLHPAP